MVIAVPGGNVRRVILDVSSFQGNVNFAQVKAQSPEVVGVIIKATEGEWPDTNPNFDEQYTSAIAAGLEVGFYCFDHTSVPSLTQANLYLGKVAGKPASLGHWLDFEANDAGSDPVEVAAHVSNWLGTVSAAYPGKVGVYTAEWAWGPWTGNADCSAYPLWVAGYTLSIPPSPAHWGAALIWQFTDAYPTYFGKCDASVFMGNDAQWAAWTSTTEDDLTPEQNTMLTTIAGAVYQGNVKNAQNYAALTAELAALKADVTAMKAAQGPGNQAILEAVKAVPTVTSTIDPTGISAAVLAELKTLKFTGGLA